MNAAEQGFQHGRMFWFGIGKIIAVREDGWWGVFDDQWDGQDEPIVAPPPEGCQTPQRGFLWCWYYQKDENGNRLRFTLGYATETEQSFAGDCKELDDGWQFTDRQGKVIVLRSGVEEPPVEEEPEGPTPETEPEPGAVPFRPWHVVILPKFALNLASFVWINKMSDGTLRARLREKVGDAVRPPLGVEFDGRDVLVFSGEHARLLWEYLELVGNTLPLES